MLFIFLMSALTKHNHKALSMWNGWSRSRSGVPVFDPWLDDYKDELEKYRNDLILDLGCGIGADTEYLIKNGYKVLSTDYSEEALKSIRENIPGSQTKYVDMNNPLPFEDNSFPIIVADISLHYFDRATTISLMGEIKRILKSGGYLLARVSSINDVNYGAGSGRQIEERFYDHGSYAQRYLNEKDVDQFFGIIGKYSFKEIAMTRKEAYYSTPKMLYQIKVQKSV